MSPLLRSPVLWGFVLNGLGLFVGIVGVGLAIQSHLKLRGARQARRETQDKLFHHMAAEQFANIARDAADIILLVRARDWNSVTKVANGLELSLRTAVGAWNPLLKGEERDLLDAAKGQVNALLESIPVGAQDAGIGEEKVQAMIGSCRFVLDMAGEITGRLRVTHLGQPEEG